MHRDVLVEMKVLGDVAGKGLSEVRGCVARLKEGLAEGGWLDAVLDVVFCEVGDGDEGDDGRDGGEGVGGGDGDGKGGGGDEGELARAVEEVVGGRGAAEEWAGRVVESWREGVKGWGMVRFE